MVEHVTQPFHLVVGYGGKRMAAEVVSSFGSIGHVVIDEWALFERCLSFFFVDKDKDNARND